MNRLFAILPFALALPILIGSALVQGSKTERWGQFPEMKEFASRLERLPLGIDSWHGKIGPPLDVDTRRVAGAEGDIQVVYTNSKTGAEVSVFLVCGRLMDMMNHRPDRCYPANGYHAVDEPHGRMLTPMSGPKAAFKVAIYGNDAVATRIFWSWSSDGIWKAPDDDDLRHEFVRTRPVFKLYFEGRVKDAKSEAEEAAMVDFINLTLPEFNKVLFPDSKPAAATSAPVAGSPSPTR